MAHYCLSRTTVPVNVTGQSTPVKSASIRRACAFPKLPNVPRHPRGDWYSPWVLICAGGVLPGMMAVDADSVTGNQLFSDRMVERNVCRFVCGTTSKFHVTCPETGVPGCGPVGSG